MLDIISEYFGEYDSYVKKDVISLLAYQSNFDSMDNLGIFQKENAKKISDEIAAELDALIEKLIREKEQINPENYDEIFSEIIKYRDLSRVADEQRFEVGLAFCERFYSYYNEDLNSCLNKGIELEDLEIEIETKDTFRNKNRYEIGGVFSRIKKEMAVIYKGANNNPERLRLQKLLSENKMKEVLIELSPKLEKKKFSSLEWEVLELRCKLRKLTQQRNLGTIAIREFMQERRKLYSHLTTLIFHKEEEKQ